MTRTVKINGRYYLATEAGVTAPVPVPATIHLQGIGDVPACPTGELKAGDRLMWNYGYIYAVVAIRPSPSGKTYEVDERSEENGKVYTRRLNADRLVAILGSR